MMNLFREHRAVWISKVPACLSRILVDDLKTDPVTIAVVGVVNIMTEEAAVVSDTKAEETATADTAVGKEDVMIVEVVIEIMTGVVQEVQAWIGMIMTKGVIADVIRMIEEGMMGKREVIFMENITRKLTVCNHQFQALYSLMYISCYLQL